MRSDAVAINSHPHPPEHQPASSVAVATFRGDYSVVNASTIAADFGRDRLLIKSGNLHQQHHSTPGVFSSVDIK